MTLDLAIRGGTVVGASDALGAYPAASPQKPENMAATIYHCLGIARDTEIHDGLGRPIPVCRGEPVKQILG